MVDISGHGSLHVDFLHISEHLFLFCSICLSVASGQLLRRYSCLLANEFLAALYNTALHGSAQLHLTRKLSWASTGS